MHPTGALCDVAKPAATSHEKASGVETATLFDGDSARWRLGLVTSKPGSKHAGSLN